MLCSCPCWRMAFVSLNNYTYSCISEELCAQKPYWGHWNAEGVLCEPPWAIPGHPLEGGQLDANQLLWGDESLTCKGHTAKRNMHGFIWGSHYQHTLVLLSASVYTSSSGKSNDRLMLCICKTPVRGADTAAHKYKPFRRLRWVKVKQILLYLTTNCPSPWKPIVRLLLALMGAGLAYSWSVEGLHKKLCSVLVRYRNKNLEIEKKN